MKILVAVLTCTKETHCKRADAQRDTWVPALRAMGIDVVFFVGGGDSNGEIYGDTVCFPVDDSYRGIPRKLQFICSWAHERNYDYMLKVDDDTYIVPQRFQWLDLDGRDYVGRFRTPYGNKPVWFASGFAYWLSRHACHVVACTPWNGDWMDERFVATALAHQDIWGCTDTQNYMVTGPHFSPMDVAANKDLNKGTVYCEYSAKNIRACHEAFKDLQPVWPTTKLQPVPPVFVDAVMLHEPVQDTVPQGKIDKWKTLLP